jgi:hypothetical protein
MTKKVLLFGLLLGIAVPVMAQSPFDGTWKTNFEKSQLAKKPFSISLQNGVYRCISCNPPYEVKADGQEHQVTGQPYFDAMTVRVVDPHTVEFVSTKNGKPAGEGKNRVSDDGNTLNSEFTGHPEGSDKPFTAKESLTRVSKAPAGAHAISGSWRENKLADVSDNLSLVTLKSTGDGLEMSDPVGESYSAKFDGKDVPYKGNPGVTSVSLKKINDRTIEETGKRDGKPIYVSHMTVSPDGKTLTTKVTDKQRGATATFVAEKQ